MRILYIYNINQVAQMYAEDLRQEGHQASVYEPSLVGAGAQFPVKFARMPERILDLRHIIHKLNTHYFDLVHIHWASYGLLGLISQIPFIVECHGSDVRYRLQHPFFRRLLTPIFRQAATVLCITPDILPVVQSVRSDALFFPGAINTDQFAPIEDTQVQSSRPWTILLFMRLDPIKGPVVATQGIARFIQRHPDVRVLLLDWGHLKETLKQRYSEHFEFVPTVPPEQVQHLLWSADVVVGQCNLGMLSFCELQAMSCAKPVICSFRYPHAYPSPPPLCQATTAEEIDDHLEHLFQQPGDARSLGQRARTWIVCYHNRQILAGRREIMYQSSIDK